MVGDARSITGNQGKNETRLQLVVAKRKPRMRGFSFESAWACLGGSAAVDCYTVAG